jgi:hypothetical protein
MVEIDFREETKRNVCIDLLGIYEKVKCSNRKAGHSQHPVS